MRAVSAPAMLIAEVTSRCAGSESANVITGATSLLSSARDLPAGPMLSNLAAYTTDFWGEAIDDRGSTIFSFVPKTGTHRIRDAMIDYPTEAGRHLWSATVFLDEWA